MGCLQFLLIDLSDVADVKNSFEIGVVYQRKETLPKLDLVSSVGANTSAESFDSVALFDSDDASGNAGDVSRLAEDVTHLCEGGGSKACNEDKLLEHYGSCTCLVTY